MCDYDIPRAAALRPTSQFYLTTPCKVIITIRHLRQSHERCGPETSRVGTLARSWPNHGPVGGEWMDYQANQFEACKYWWCKSGQGQGICLADGFYTISYDPKP